MRPSEAVILFLLGVVYGGAHPAFSQPEVAGQVIYEDIQETSGMAASTKNPGTLWVHNDAGSAPRLFAIDYSGGILGVFRVSQIESGDFEAIAIGPGTSPRSQHVFFGDIGDNSENRTEILVYEIPEPAVYSYFSEDPPSEPIRAMNAFYFKYPDGPHNAEAMIVDPLRNELILFTKETNQTRGYQISLSGLDPSKTNELAHGLTLPFFEISDATIAPDGREVVLRREDAAWLWERKSTESLFAAMSRTPLALPVVAPPDEPNGEAISFSHDGRYFFTLSEGKNQDLYRFTRTSPDFPYISSTILEKGETWKYLDSGSYPGADWKNVSFNDSQWLSGNGQFGYGQADEQTLISYGGNPEQKRVTTLFRKNFHLDKVTTESVLMHVAFDDGAVVYVNGVEAWRTNLFEEASLDAPATESNNQFENIWHSVPLGVELFNHGLNLLAVEIHRKSLKEADMSFDLKLEGRRRLLLDKPILENASVVIPVFGPVQGQVVIERSQNFSQWAPHAVLQMIDGTSTFEVNNDDFYNFFRMRLMN